MPFLLWHFSPGYKIENCSAQFLSVCWIVRALEGIRIQRSIFPLFIVLCLSAAAIAQKAPP
jgi:hypothetical protein